MNGPGLLCTHEDEQQSCIDISEGGKTGALFATLPDDGSRGGYFHLGQKLQW
jgi:hypothetical protein